MISKMIFASGILYQFQFLFKNDFFAFGIYNPKICTSYINYIYAQLYIHHIHKVQVEIEVRSGRWWGGGGGAKDLITPD